MNLQIKHVGRSEDYAALFMVVNNGKNAQRDPIPIPSPWKIMVGTQPLRQGLKWYLEKYLALPVDSYKKLAEDVQAALFQWGRDCFDALFYAGQAGNWYRDAYMKSLSDLHLEIVSDEADVLSWPWEVLESKQNGGRLALQCRIHRRLDTIGNVPPLPNLPDNELSILYIISRPEKDVLSFQTQPRRIIDYVRENGWPVHIDVLRPPTFRQLEDDLENKAFQIVHFDGHGSFSGDGGGALVFENDDNEHSADHVAANKLGELLRKYNIPVMVLDACRSAAQDESGEDPFASVAVSLLNANIHSVIANSYSIFDSSAKIFVPAFYERLFKTGCIADAVQNGRRELLRKQERSTVFGKIAFQDWIIPVLYQHEDNFLPRLKPGSVQKSALLQEFQMLGDYVFTGRDSAIHQLERAIRRKPAGILIHGMAGEGKTTLSKGFLQWLDATNGLGDRVFWFSFKNINSTGHIIDELTGELFGADARALPAEQKLAAVTRELRARYIFIVWDNFESASGISGAEAPALLSDIDREQLKQLLHGLKGGNTKIIVSPEYFRAVS